MVMDMRAIFYVANAGYTYCKQLTHKMAATALIVELFSKWRHCHRMY